MRSLGRKIFPIAAAVLFIGAVVWALSFERLEPADFTFVNGTEIKSVDPAIVTGQPEGRAIRALYEGLVGWDPKTLRPVPGVAKLVPDGAEQDGRPKWRANVSEDGKTYTFRLRKDARWSNGDPITSADFMYSFRRFLDPLTGAEYAYQLFYVVGAEKYNRGEFAVGDPVEVELRHPPEGAPPHARGEVVRGVLRSQETIVIGDGKSSDEDDPPTVNLYVVETPDGLRQFKTGKVGELKDKHDDYEVAKQVLVDFSTVGIKAPDEHTLTFELKYRTPFFVDLLGFYPLFPVHQATIEQLGYPAWTRPGNIVTNGAYTLHSRRIRDRIRLVKNEEYWDAANVKMKIVDMLAVEDETTALNLYETGKVDWITNVPQTIIPELESGERDDFFKKPMLSTYYYRINVNKPGLDDPRVRRALALAIDRPTIVSEVTRANELPAFSFVPPGMAGYAAQEFERGDLAVAQQLLADAGYPNGDGLPKISLVFNTNAGHKKIAEFIAALWKDRLGIDVSLQQMEWNAYLETQRQIKYDVARAGWIGDYADPNTFLDMFVTGGANNQTGWSNKEYDRLVLELAPREDDPAKRLELLQQAERILMTELPIVPIYFSISKGMIRPYVKGYYHNIQDVHPIHYMSIDEEERRRFWEGDRPE